MRAEKTYNLNGTATGLNIHFNEIDISFIKDDLEEKEMITLSSEELLLILRDYKN